jgi:hypothetical protein
LQSNFQILGQSHKTQTRLWQCKVLLSDIVAKCYFNILLYFSDKPFKTNDRNGQIQLKQLFEKHLKIGYDIEFENEVQNKLGD